MEPATTTMVSLGVLLLVALAVDRVAQRLPLPQVTLLLLVGLAVGPAGLDLLPPVREVWEPIVTELALVMVGFLIGSDLRWPELRDHGTGVTGLATIGAVVTAATVVGGLLLAGVELPLAFALGGIAAATAPAATLAVIDESRAEGPLTRTVVGIVAVDDALSITLFSVLVAAAVVVTGDGGAGSLLVQAVREVGGGIVLGVVIGLPAAALTGRLREGRPTLLEALALVLLTAGLGAWLEVSFLLAAIVAGGLVANLARHHERAFHEIERIDWPFLALTRDGAALDRGDPAATGRRRPRSGAAAAGPLPRPRRHRPAGRGQLHGDLRARRTRPDAARAGTRRGGRPRRQRC